MNTKKLLLAFSLLMVLSASATAASTQNNSASVDPGLMPGDIFYPVESFAESLEVQVAGLVGGPDFQAKALANNAEESLTEASILADRNRPEKASQATQNYFKQLNKSKTLSKNSGNRNLSEQLDNISGKNVETLEKVKEKVPEQARKGIEKAIENSANSRPGKGNNPAFDNGVPGTAKGQNGAEKAQKSLGNASKTLGNISKNTGSEKGKHANLSANPNNKPNKELKALNTSNESGNSLDGLDQGSDLAGSQESESENISPKSEDSSGDRKDNNPNSLDKNPLDTEGNDFP